VLGGLLGGRKVLGAQASSAVFFEAAEVQAAG
jgi:hypothetical protein